MNIVSLDTNLLEAFEESVAMVQQSVNDDAGAEAERQEIGDSVCRREEERGVLVVGLEVEGSVRLEHAGDVVRIAVSVVGPICGNREVAKLPRLRKTRR